MLPDPKLPGSDKDVIVWLDADYAAQQEEEALQRGAVAALHAVAGERSLDYVLPVRYRQLWKDIGNKVRGVTGSLLSVTAKPTLLITTDAHCGVTCQG